MKKRAGLTILLLVWLVDPVLAGGGDWKMGPFGPYWEDNEWPEFTPMYWMEEFMNRLDDDDDEISEWMLRNQFPQRAAPGTGWPSYDPYGGNTPGVAPPYGWQPNAWNNPWGQPWAGQTYNSYAVPYQGTPGAYIARGNNQAVERGVARADDTASWREAPGIRSSPGRRDRRALRRSSGREPGGQIPRLTREEFSRMPREWQREYKRALDRDYRAFSRQRPDGYLGSLPNLSPQEFTSMPPELQREYKHAFDREYAALKARQAREREARLRRPGYDLNRR